MNRSIAVSAAVLAGVAALGLLSTRRREAMGSAVSRRMLGRMEKVMAKLPDNSPPKLVMTVLPRLREQNEEILASLREQNALLREYLQRQQ